MFYNVVVNDWGETTYVPTTLGNILLAVVIIALLGVAMYFAGKGNKKVTKKLSAKQLAFCALAIALGTVLSNIKVFHFPTGGSITLLSMLMIALPGYWFGLGAGIMTGVAYGILRLLIDPYVLYPMQLVVDYAVISGWIFFGAYAWEGWDPLPYSLAYNAIYIFAEAAITVAILCIPPVKDALARVKKMAIE